MNKEELLEKIESLEQENKKLKERLKKKNKRKNIKTPVKEIVEYWSKHQDECGLSVDWSEAHERCWRCGYKKRLQKCHIIPDSLGGKDEPSNLVLLCARCHIDAPNVESKTFMWDWIRANGTSFYNAFWFMRAQKEYEFIYGTSFLEELKARDIISDYDLRLFFNLKIGRSIHHFAHPWNNESTDAGLFRMRLEEYDKHHKTIQKKSKNYRDKEQEFNFFMGNICDIASKYKFNVWEGRSKNRFSVTISSFINREKYLNISIKLCNDNIYRACFTKEINPNNNCTKDYVIELGTKEKTLEFLMKEIEEFIKNNGINEKQDYVFTINPIYSIIED